MFSNCIFWVGVVENNIDPIKRGRVQVRIFGAHDIYNPPLTDAQGRTSWEKTYSKSSNVGGLSGISSGGMPNNSSNGNELKIWQRYNNPMNLKNVNGTWRRFDDISLAYPAYYKQLNLYYKRGKVTPAQMISTWAPPNENRTREYINNVHKWTGLDMYSQIDMNDYNQVAKLLRGMTRMESSLNFSEGEIVSALQGNIVPSMTNVSTVYKDGKLYTGSSNAAQGTSNTSQGTSNSSTTKTNTIGPSNNNTQSTTVKQPEQKSGTVQSTPTTNNNTSGHNLPTEDLPWAICLYSAIEYGGTSYSTVPAPQVQNGAWVFGMSLDGDFMNQLLVLGVIPNAINIDVLSLNKHEANAQSLGTQNANVARQMRNMPNIDTKLNTSSMSFQQLLQGVWNAESSKGTNKAPSSAHCYGTMQLAPALAAGYLLQGIGSDALKNAGWSMDDETIAMLKYLSETKNGSQRGFWGQGIEIAMENNPKVKDFCNLLQENDSLNMALGAAYLRDCGRESQGNGDPVLTALYYNQGAPNARMIMKEIGASPNKIPDNMSYEEFVNKVNEIILPNQNNNFKIYTDNIFKDVGGIAQLEKERGA